MANYNIQTGTLIEDFETVGDWTTGNGSLAAESTLIKTGSKSLKITSASGASGFGTKTISLALGSNNVHGFWVYVTDVTILADLILYLSNDSGFTNYYQRTLTPTNSRIFTGWNFLIIRKEDWVANGTPSWDTTMVRMRVRCDGTASQVAIVYFDSYYTNPYGRPKCIITFDDIPATAYTVGYAYMDARGLKGTFFPAGAFMDTGSYMTTAQLTTAYNNGWDACNHTYNHYNLSTLGTQAEVEAEIVLQRAWLVARGFTRTAEFVAYPQGGYNDTVVAAMTAQSILISRSTLFGTQTYQPHSKGIFNPQILRIGGVINTTTLAAAQAAIDNAIQIGGTVCFVFHDLVTSGADTSVKWLTADFQSLIDYVVTKQNQMDVVTLSEWYYGLTAPRKRV